MSASPRQRHTVSFRPFTVDGCRRAASLPRTQPTWLLVFVCRGTARRGRSLAAYEQPAATLSRSSSYRHHVSRFFVFTQPRSPGVESAKGHQWGALRLSSLYVVAQLSGLAEQAEHRLWRLV